MFSVKGRRKLLNFLLPFFILSCSTTTEEKVISDENTYIENFSLKGLSQDKNYTLNALKARTDSAKNIFVLDGITFKVNSELTVSAENGKYFKQKNLITLEKVSSNYRNLSLTAGKADYLIADTGLEITTPDINYFNHKFSGSSATFDENAGVITVKQIKARLRL